MMRFVLAVAVLVGCAAHEDPVAIDTIILREYENNADQSSYTTVGAGYQPQADTPIVAFITQTATSADGPTAIIANGLTWLPIGASQGAAAHRIFAYLAVGAAPTLSEMQVDFNPDDITTGIHVVIVECRGVSLFGPIAQSDGDFFSASLGTTVSVADPLEHEDSVLLYGLEAAGGANVLVPSAGFSVLAQVEHALPGRFMAVVAGGAEVDTPTWQSSANGAWIALALRPKLTPEAGVEKRIIAILGQSNATGGAKTEDATLIAPAELDTDFPQVTIDEYIDTTGVQFDRYFARPLSPRNNLGSFGAELSMGRALNAFFPPGGEVVILKCGNNGTGLDAYWKPSANQGYPIARDYFRQMQIEFGGKIEAIVWIQGNGDAKAGTSGPSDNYAENLTALFNQLKTDLGNDRLAFVLDEYPFGGTFAAAVRAEQVAFVQATPGTAIIEADDAPQRDDDHYAADGKILLGWRFAYALKGLLDKPPRFRGSIAVR